MTPDVKALSRDLTEFANSIEGLWAYACGPDVGIRERSADFAVCAAFETEEAVRRYLDDPDHHLIVTKHLAGAVDERHSIQFQSM